jgi:hypothetical protein
VQYVSLRNIAVTYNLLTFESLCYEPIVLDGPEPKQHDLAADRWQRHKGRIVERTR